MLAAGVDEAAVPRSQRSGQAGKVDASEMFGRVENKLEFHSNFVNVCREVRRMRCVAVDACGGRTTRSMVPLQRMQEVANWRAKVLSEPAVGIGVQ